jgi:predicted  nucleic acid-binding Zn-ribbon protein
MTDLPEHSNYLSVMDHWRQIFSIVTGAVTGSLGSLLLFLLKLRSELKKDVESVEAPREAQEQAGIEQLKERIEGLADAGERRDSRLASMEAELRNVNQNMTDIKQHLNRVLRDTSVIFTHLMKK